MLSYSDTSNNSVVLLYYHLPLIFIRKDLFWSLLPGGGMASGTGLGKLTICLTFILP